MPSETQYLKWLSLNPAQLAEGSDGIQMAASLTQDTWDNLLYPGFKASIQLTRMMSMLVANVSTPTLPGVADSFQELADLIQGFLDSGVHATYHHNIRRNPRYVPGAIRPEGRVEAEVLISMNGLSHIVNGELRYRPRKGSVVVNISGGFTATDDGAGGLVGTGVQDGVVDYAKKWVSILMDDPVDAGDTTVDYAKQSVPTDNELQTIWPFTGTGVDGFLRDLTRSFPQSQVDQSVAGFVVLGGARSPDEFGTLMELLANVFGNGAFARAGESLKHSSKSLAASGEAFAERLRSPGSDRLHDGARIGPPEWLHLRLTDLVPPLGDVSSVVKEFLQRFLPPKQIEDMSSAVLCALEEKLGAVEAVVDKISSVLEVLKTVSEADGLNLYVLPIGELTAGGTWTPFGADPSGQVSNGQSTPAAFTHAVNGALWPIDPLNPDAGYSAQPPASLKGDAYVGGVAILGTTGQWTDVEGMLSAVPTAAQLLSSIFETDPVESGMAFGATVQELTQRPPTSSSVQIS